MSFKFFLPVLGLVISLSSFAGIFIEPYVGYLSVKHSGDYDNYGDQLEVPTESGKGPAYGARAGYGIGIFGLGLDFMTSNLKEEHDFKSKITNIGATLMVGLPLIRGWAGYIFSSEYELDDSDIPGTEKGSGFKLGVGWTPFPLLSINLEYLMLKYDEAKYENFQDVERDTNGFLLSLSMPIVFK